MPMKLIKKYFSTKIFREKQADRPYATTLLTAIDNARQDWRQAVEEMNYIDSELAEYVIYKINSAERYYMTLLAQAKQEGITAWSASPEYNTPISLNTHP